MEQMIFRMYPPGYTGNSLGELNELLKNGWIVKRVDKIEYEDRMFNDYLLERQKP